MTVEAIGRARPYVPGWRDRAYDQLPLIIGFVILALPTLIALGQQSWTTELGAHGPIVLATGIWLIWHSMRPDMVAPPPRGWRGIALLLPALAIYIFGRAYDFISLEAGGLYLVMVAIAWRVLRPAAFRSLIGPLVYFAFLIPPPGWLVDQLTAPLQLFASEAATHSLAALGYPIINTGVTIFIAQYQLLVEQACSGMNSLVGLSAIMTFYVYLMHRSSWRYGMVMVLLILPIAIVVNIIRIIGLILITYYWGDAAAQGFLHMTTGIVLFGFALFLAFAVDSFAQMLLRRRRAAA